MKKILIIYFVFTNIFAYSQANKGDIVGLLRVNGRYSVQKENTPYEGINTPYSRMHSAISLHVGISKFIQQSTEIGIGLAWHNTNIVYGDARKVNFTKKIHMIYSPMYVKRYFPIYKNLLATSSLNVTPLIQNEQYDKRKSETLCFIRIEPAVGLHYWFDKQFGVYFDTEIVLYNIIYYTDYKAFGTGPSLITGNNLLDSNFFRYLNYRIGFKFILPQKEKNRPKE